MDLNLRVAWYYCLFAMLPLIIAIYQILDYLTFKAFGVTSILVLICFSMFFFLRRNYNFNVKTIAFFYFTGFAGALLLGYSKQDWLLLFMVLSFWIILSQTSSLSSLGRQILTKIKMESSDHIGLLSSFLTPTRIQEAKKLALDVIFLLLFTIVCLFIYSSLFNLFS